MDRVRPRTVSPDLRAPRRPKPDAISVQDPEGNDVVRGVFERGMGGRQGVLRDEDPHLQAALATASKARQVQAGQAVRGLDLLNPSQGGNEEVEGRSTVDRRAGLVAHERLVTVALIHSH
jgi:hypothetical protein